MASAASTFDSVPRKFRCRRSTKSAKTPTVRVASSVVTTSSHSRCASAPVALLTDYTRLPNTRSREAPLG